MEIIIDALIVNVDIKTYEGRQYAKYTFLSKDTVLIGSATAEQGQHLLENKGKTVTLKFAVVPNKEMKATLSLKEIIKQK